MRASKFNDRKTSRELSREVLVVACRLNPAKDKQMQRIVYVESVFENFVPMGGISPGSIVHGNYGNGLSQRAFLLQMPQEP